MWQDLRYCIRSLSRQPSLALIAIAVLAVGVGLNTAIYSAVSALLFRPMAAADPQALVYVYRSFAKEPEHLIPVPHRVFEALRARRDIFAGLSGTWALSLRVTALGEAEMLRAEQVQPDYFAVLGVRAHAGRTLLASDHDPTATEAAIVISHEFWRRRFNSDPGVLGLRVRVAEELEHHFTIVGIADPDFKGISDPWTPTDFWVPSWIVERQVIAAPPGVRVSLLGIGRLQEGMQLAQARAAAGTQAGALFPDGQTRILLQPVSDVRLPYDPRKAVIPTRLSYALMFVVLVVMLVGVANITGVLLARGVSRAPEVAIRRALGASGLRIGRQLVLESVLLAVIGGAIGLLLSHWLLAVFNAATPVKYALDASLDWRSAVFAFSISAFCGALMAVAPILQATRMDVRPALANAGLTTTSASGRRLGHAIVLPQVALSLALMLLALAYLRGHAAIEMADWGYDQSGVTVVSTVLRPSGAASVSTARPYYDALIERLGQMKAATAAITSTLPLHSPSSGALSSVATGEGRDMNDADEAAMRSTVSPGYFQTLGIRLLRGRDFDARDTPAAPAVGIISESLAASLWPGRNAVGRQATIIGPSPRAKPATFEVVGVVDDIRPVLGDVEPTPYVYLAMGQQRRPTTTFIVGRSLNSRSATEQVRAAVSAASPLAEPFRARTLEGMIDEILYPRRVAAAVLFGSGGIALLLACAGLYGVISYWVSQQLREIGVRRALGADAGAISRLVVVEGLKIAGMGSILGSVLGYAALRMASSRFPALPPLDVLTLSATVLLLMAVVVVACSVPALRATRVDPLEVLRAT